MAVKGSDLSEIFQGIMANSGVDWRAFCQGALYVLCFCTYRDNAFGTCAINVRAFWYSFAFPYV